MRSDIAPGATFPDYELPDHENLPRKLSEIGGENEVAGKRPVGEGCRLTNYLSGVIGPRQPKAAEAAGI